MMAKTGARMQRTLESFPALSPSRSRLFTSAVVVCPLACFCSGVALEVGKVATNICHGFASILGQSINKVGA